MAPIIREASSDAKDTNDKWAQELEAIHRQCKDEQAAAGAAFEAAKVNLDTEIEDKRKTMLARLQEDVHRYMTETQREFDNMLGELRSERLARLKAEYDTLFQSLKREERKKRLTHYDKFVTWFTVGNSDLVSPQLLPHFRPHMTQYLASFDAYAEANKTSSLHRARSLPRTIRQMLAPAPISINLMWTSSSHNLSRT